MVHIRMRLNFRTMTTCRNSNRAPVSGNFKFRFTNRRTGFLIRKIRKLYLSNSVTIQPNPPLYTLGGGRKGAAPADAHII
jgi:hypothetical protein